MSGKENQTGQPKTERAGSRQSVYLITPSGSTTLSEAEKMKRIREKARSGQLGKLTHTPSK